MAISTWKTATTGSWNTGGRWTSGGPPGANSDVSIAIAGNYTATLANSSNTIDSLTINNASDTGPVLLIASSGALNVTGSGVGATDTLSIQAGTVQIAGNGVIHATSIVFGGASSVLSGAGTITGVLSGAGGIVTASGGTLDMVSAIGTATGLNYQVGNPGTSVLRLDGAVGSTNTFTLLGTTGDALELRDVTASSINFKGIASGLVDAIIAAPDLSAVNYINLQDAAAPITTVTMTSSTTLELFHNATDLGTITLGAAAPGKFVNWGVDSAQTGHTIGSGTDIWISDAVCYARGTMILTPEGEIPVERLRAGRQVMTVVDGEQTAQPVKWLGHRRIDLTGHPQPETVAPIRILRGAFADNTPHRDLVVSPDHAIFVDGSLICARQLVNGSTIQQETGWTAVDYYHVQLDRHAILLAEGLPAESYIDTGNSGFFSNSGAPLALRPDLTDTSDRPSREAGSCAPFVSDEAIVRPVWQRLADRAAQLGRPVPMRETTTDPGLQLIARGRRTKPIFVNAELAIFALPRGVSEIGLVSHAASPTDARPWLDDRRLLGVRIARIVLRGVDEVREIPIDHPDFGRGWWAVEPGRPTMSRWTNGEAVLPLPAMRGAAMLEIHLAGTMTYVVESAAEDGAGRRAA